jgi:glycerol uptake facilitator-like aquaporin
MASFGRRIFSEWLGTAFLLAAVVGSGIMGQKLSGGNVALALLCNTIPTGAILVVLILVFGPLSGAHFNPVVSLAFAMRRELPWSLAGAYIAAQIVGAVIGVWVAHLMFELPVLQLSTTARVGWGQWTAEAVAAFGLLLTILGCVAKTPSAVPYAVGLYITSAYWFTASTCSEQAAQRRQTPKKASSERRIVLVWRRNPLRQFFDKLLIIARPFLDQPLWKALMQHL